MQDLSLLFVKPDGMKFYKQIGQEVKRRGYDALFEEQRAGWIPVQTDIYLGQHGQRRTEALNVSYSMLWSDQFGFYVLLHPEGNTIQRLKKDQGHFNRYQIEDDGSLRRMFGRGAEMNVFFEHGFIIPFNAIHAPDSEAELYRHFDILGLKESQFR